MEVSLCQCPRCQFSFVDAQARAAGMQVTTRSPFGPQPKPVQVFVHTRDVSVRMRTDPALLMLTLPYLPPRCEGGTV